MNDRRPASLLLKMDERKNGQSNLQGTLRALLCHTYEFVQASRFPLLGKILNSSKTM